MLGVVEVSVADEAAAVAGSVSSAVCIPAVISAATCSAGRANAADVTTSPVGTRKPAAASRANVAVLPPTTATGNSAAS